MKYPEILSIEPAPVAFAYDADYTILYALGLGAGAAADDLSFVYERDLVAIPTMAVVLAQGGEEIISEGALDVPRILHGEQRLTIHRPLPAAAEVLSRSRCTGVVDKGAERGALVYMENTISDAADGALLATSLSTLFCRGDGGFDGPVQGGPAMHVVPCRPHDLELAMPTIPQQAALYRLMGDKNPLHIDPDFAEGVGFDRPILHGLCTYGIACRAVLQACCDNDPARIERFDARFAAPVLPGETIETRIWQDRRDVSFECRVRETGALVVRGGRCVLRTG